MRQDEKKYNRRTILALSLVPMFAVAIALMTLGYISTKHVVTEGVRQYLASTTESGVAGIESWLMRHIAQIEEMASNPEITSLEHNRVNAFLSGRLRRYLDYSSFWLSDLEGNWYSPLGTSGSIAERAYFPIAIETKHPVVSNPLIGQADGKLVVVIAAPVFVGGKMKALLGANVMLSELVEQISSIRVGRMGFVSLYENDGLTVIDQGSSGTLKYNPFNDTSNALSRVKDEILGPKSGIHKLNALGRDIFVYNTRLKLTDWVMVSTAYSSEFFEPLSKELKLNLAVAAAMLVIATIIVVCFARKKFR